MFLSLPPSLLALAFCLLDKHVLADSASPSPTSQNGNIGGYVASGLGMDNGSTQQTGIPAIATTGTGPEYASSCAAALQAWSSSSFDWQWSNDIVSTSTFSSAFTETVQKPGTTKVTSVITLCDGHPRVVGHTSTSRGGNYTTTVAWTNTITDSAPNHAYPTPTPCSIQPSDCKVLSKSYDSSLSSVLKSQGWATGGGPLCTVTPSSTVTYSTNSQGQQCNNCLIAASSARVMFWPVTTASGGNLCNKTASTITASPTGPPNSFITEGITITSPTVAVSLAYLSRVDGCGTTIAHTIIPVRPEEVTSVRGYRALFSHHRFNFADLNYFCMDTNTTNVTIADGQGDSCYQEVPAAAYFGGLNNAAVLAQAPFWNLTKEQMTIWDNYQPQLLPPATMTKAIASIWGDGCLIHPDGVWDPPIALTPEANLIVPTAPGGESDAPESTPASPINSYGAQPARPTGIKVPTDPSNGDTTSARQHFTALPETGGYGGSGSDDNGSNDGSGSSGSDNNSGSDSNSGSDNNSGSGSNSDSDSNSDSSSNSGSDTNPGSNSNSGSSSNSDTNNNSGSDSNSNSDSNSGSNNGAGQSGAGNSNGGGVTQVNVHTTIITIGNTVVQCTEDSQGNWHVPGVSSTQVVSPGGPAVDVGSATLTAGSNGLVKVHDTNTALTIGNKVITCSQDASGKWAIGDSSTTHMISQGGTAVQVDGVMITAASQGLVTMHGSNSVLTAGNKAITGSQDASGNWVLSDSSKTYTISQGGSAVRVDGMMVTAASQGIVKADGSSDTSSESGAGTNAQSAGATRSSSGAQSTGTTGSDGAAATTSTDSSGSGAMKWSPASLTFALLSVALYML